MRKKEKITMGTVKLLKTEDFVRVLSMVLATMTALVVGLDAETKKVFIIERKATVHDLQALWVATIVASATAGYHLLQLCLTVGFSWIDKNPCRCSKLFAWIRFVFDQGAAYAIFVGTVRGAQGSLVALFGVKALQWDKVCNIYTRFCVEIGGGVACGLLASIAMAVVSTASAYRLFCLYSIDRRSVSRVAGPGPDPTF